MYLSRKYKIIPVIMDRKERKKKQREDVREENDLKRNNVLHSMNKLKQIDILASILEIN